MPKKISQKFSKKGKQPLFNSSQQKTSALKKVQNEKTPKSTNYKNTMKLNNTNSEESEESEEENSNEKDLIPTPLLARPQAEKQFRDFYMNQITKAFGEDLDKLRKKVKLVILIIDLTDK
ncbi:10198_t:CDS:2 [Rhizophagus irregularis]|nr:10198_t:CDS:2 [Rhizophagus irregularis]